MAATNIANLSEARKAKLVDELGELKAQIALLEDAFDQKVALFKVFGFGEYNGKQYKLVVSSYVSERLDSTKAKALLTPAQVAKCTKTSTVIVAAVKAR